MVKYIIYVFILPTRFDLLIQYTKLSYYNIGFLKTIRLICNVVYYYFNLLTFYQRQLLPIQKDQTYYYVEIRLRC